MRQQLNSFDEFLRISIPVGLFVLDSVFVHTLGSLIDWLCQAVIEDTQDIEVHQRRQYGSGYELGDDSTVGFCYDKTTYYRRCRLQCGY